MAHDETKQGHRNSIFDRGDSDRGSEETAALDRSDPSQLITSCGVGTMSCGRTSPARELKSQSCYHDRDSEPKEVESLASDVHNNRSSDRSEGDGKYSQDGNSKNEALPERHISLETEKSSPALPNTQMAVSSLMAMAQDRQRSLSSHSHWNDFASTKLDLGSSQETRSPKSDRLRRYRRKISIQKSNSKGGGAVDKSVFDFPSPSEQHTVNISPGRATEVRGNTSPKEANQSKDLLHNSNCSQENRKVKRVMADEVWDSQETNPTKKKSLSSDSKGNQPLSKSAKEDMVEVDENDIPVSWSCGDLPTLKFAVLWAQLEEAGWSWSKGQKLISYHWKRPNADIRSGIEVLGLYSFIFMSYYLGRGLLYH